MSDIDDLLDDNDKIEMKQPTRPRHSTMQLGSKKSQTIFLERLYLL